MSAKSLGEGWIKIHYSLFTILNSPPAYSISKAALNMVTKQLHAQHARDGFIVISLGPGHNQTDMGGKGAPLKPKDSVKQAIQLITNLDKSKSGNFYFYNGTQLPW